MNANFNLFKKLKEKPNVKELEARYLRQRVLKGHSSIDRRIVFEIYC